MNPGRKSPFAEKANSPILSLELKEIHAPFAGKDRVMEEGDSFMQSLFWARFKSKTGWKSFLCTIEIESEAYRTAIVVLVKALTLGFSFAYIPHGPGTVPPSMSPDAFLEAVSEKIAGGIAGRLMFIRFDLPWDREVEKARFLLESISDARTRLKRGLPVQVPDTTILNLEKTEEELLAGMKPKWRYNIRLSEKKGVEVGREGAEALGIFYHLYEETARRDGIAIHPLSYYKTLLETVGELGGEAGGDKPPSMSVWIAMHEGLPVASIITLFWNRHATYLYGASSNEKRNLMPAYALQWKAITAAKREGCIDYDFFGIPPDEDPSHAMAGLYLFKTGFGGSIVHRVGSIDYPVSRAVYAVFRGAEALRLFWHKKVKKLIKTMIHASRKVR
ncbi:MAG TPA: peptidoglycan bridge formation glycyltransferase FemA/FemB family protein [Rectinemataceae bacterium]|nr:peptidoglycan bridge formation glycyltransferase FemA/FemB family protein [Rectinemataceae bacterium]